MPSFKIGFTGTQNGMTQEQRAKLIEWIYNFNVPDLPFIPRFNHGDCIGADVEAHDLVRHFTKWRIEARPGYGKDKNDTSKRAFCRADVVYPAKPYLARNVDIIDAANIVIATPKESKEKRRSGTWATIRYARKLVTPVTIHIIYPDGAWETEVRRNQEYVGGIYWCAEGSGKISEGNENGSDTEEDQQST